MPGTDDRLVLWYHARRRPPSRLLFLIPAAFALVAVASRSWYPLSWVALTLPQAWLAVRGATVLTQEGVTTGVLRRRSFGWADVRAVRASPYLPNVAALLADGTAVTLRAVEWWGPRPEGRAPRNSVQNVLEWARARGHDVPVVEG